MQETVSEHVYTLLIGYRSGGTPGFPQNLRARDGICGPSTREQCLPAPQQAPGSSCCPSLLAGGFRLTTGINMSPPAIVKIDTHPNKQILLLSIYFLVGDFAIFFLFRQTSNVLFCSKILLNKTNSFVATRLDVCS